MYLKSLELHGFKSFPNRTVLNFERGTTVVVGPNGSGKSNISDAMRWVLGELSSRSIRGTKMEDVIFGGTNDRRPMGFAEVSVCFDNTDKSHALNLPYDEVVVTRRYYRAGESEYFINRKPCRLRDIYELFMNTGVGREGYSIIGQGRIAEILSKKSEDRRNFFEEAAGISKFRFKKQEAERKLQDTENNMVRVRDILSELEGRVEPLRRDSEKARRYLELYDTKKKADVALWLYDTQKLSSDIRACEEACALSENELALIAESLSSLEAQNDRLDEQQRSNRLRSEQLLTQIRDHTKNINHLDNAFQLLQKEAKHREEMIADCKQRIFSSNQTLVSMAEECRSHEAKISGLHEQEENFADEHLTLLAEQQAKMQAAQELEKALAGELEASKELENAAVDLRVRMDVLKNTRKSGDDRSEGLLAEIRRYEEEGEKLRKEAERCERNAEGFKNKIAELDGVIRGGIEETDSAGAARAEKVTELSDYQVQKSALLQRVETLQRMEEHFEGYNNSVRFVMQRYEQNAIRGAGKIYGPLSKLISTEKDYIIAIETALGASIQNIVVDHESTAKAAMNCLKENRAGRATFYPVSAIRAAGETEEIRRASSFAGYVNRADKLVSFDKPFTEIVEWLLARTVVFDHIDHATEAAKALHYRVKIVTLDGQVINAGGSFTGGSVKHDSGIMSRASEIESLKKDAEKIAAKIARAEREVAALDGQLENVHNAVREAEQQKELLLTMSRAQFAALDSAKAKLEANENLIGKLRADYDSIAQTARESSEEVEKLHLELSMYEAKIRAIAERRNTLEVDKNAILDEKDALAARASEVQIRIAEVRGEITAASNAIQTAKLRIEEIKQDNGEQQERIAEHEKWLLDHKTEIALNRRERDKLDTSLTEIDSNRQNIESDNDDFDKRLAELKLQIRNKQNQKDLCVETDNRNKRKLERLTEEFDRISSKLLDDYELTAENARKLDYPPVTAENHSAFVATQTECRQKIKALGSVNIAAIEEYDLVKERYETLSEQVNDLNHSYEELTGIVTKIEAEMKTSFVAAFTEINKNFGIVFRELFGGGQAELFLTDPEDVLNCGIEIKAAPPGKIIKSLALLSGGEQAFVACALFFAILKVNPTPFCLLDEIEAALDEVNVYRLGEYIKKFCGETQFILITHRRGTMQIADRLYGVTMPERGISRVIALDMNEMESRSKEFTDGLL